MPQGSVLGPLLFLYANDICNTADFNVRLFANHTLLFTSCKEAHTLDLEYNVDAEIGKMQVWLQANKLSSKISQTKYMKYHQNLNPIINLKLNF